MFGSSGKLENETSVKQERCKKVREEDSCFESCVKKHLNGRLPEYDVRAGRPYLRPSPGAQQCHVFAQPILNSCANECKK